MDRELLIEVGVEEIPASWLPALTAQVAHELEARLKELRLPPSAPIEAFSTPRRLTARVGKLAERQTDLRGGAHRPASVRGVRARRQADAGRRGLRQEAGRRGRGARAASRRPKGTYLSFKKQLRGKAAVDVLPDVLVGAAARADVPEGDALGRDARRRQERAALWPADSLDAVSLRRPGRAVLDRIARRSRRARSCRRCARAPSPSAIAS